MGGKCLSFNVTVSLLKYFRELLVNVEDFSVIGLVVGVVEDDKATLFCSVLAGYSNVFSIHVIFLS